MCYMNLHDFPKAITIAEECVSTQMSNMDPHHPLVANSL